MIASSSRPEGVRQLDDTNGKIEESILKIVTAHFPRCAIICDRQLVDSNAICIPLDYRRCICFRSGVGRWTLSFERFLLHSTTGFPSVITRTFSSILCSRADLSKRCGGSCSGSKPRRKV